MKLIGDERGVVIPYLTVFLLVIVIAFVWIVCNEVLLHVGDWAHAEATESFGFTYNWLIVLFRITPFVLLFSGVLWALLQAHREGAF